ncbi:MAG: hypothetical protein RSD36_17865 [Terrisporobacter sp.]
MKKLLSFILCCILCFVLVGCEDGYDTDSSDTPNVDITNPANNEDSKYYHEIGDRKNLRYDENEGLYFDKAGNGYDENGELLIKGNASDLGEHPWNQDDYEEEPSDTNDNLTQEEKDKQQLEKDNPTGYYVTCPECGEKVFTVNGDWDCSHDSNNNNDDINVNPDSQEDDYDPNENNYTKPNSGDLGEHPWNQDGYQEEDTSNE